VTRSQPTVARHASSTRTRLERRENRTRTLYACLTARDAHGQSAKTASRQAAASAKKAKVPKPRVQSLIERLAADTIASGYSSRPKKIQLTTAATIVMEMPHASNWLKSRRVSVPGGADARHKAPSVDRAKTGLPSRSTGMIGRVSPSSRRTK